MKVDVQGALQLLSNKRDRQVKEFARLLSAELAASQARERVLREALDRFADTDNWFHTADEPGGPFTAWRGNGEPDEIAQEALNQTKEGEP